MRWWPRCGMVFVASAEDYRMGRWRTCTRPWLHLSAHSGTPGSEPPRGWG